MTPQMKPLAWAVYQAIGYERPRLHCAFYPYRIYESLWRP